MTVIVHHLEHSRSLRILWLLEELAVPYEIKSYARTPEFRAPDSLKQIHPLGRAPVVETDGLVLAESGAVIEYFTEREGKLKPSAGEELLRYRFFLHYAEGSAMPPLLVQLIADKLAEAPAPFFIKPILKGAANKLEENFSGPALQLHFGFVNAELQGRSYFAGEGFTAADIQMFYAVEAALQRGGARKAEWSNLRAWRERVTSRAAYRRAEERGGTAMPS